MAISNVKFPRLKLPKVAVPTGDDLGAGFKSALQNISSGAYNYPKVTTPNVVVPNPVGLTPALTKQLGTLSKLGGVQSKKLVKNRSTKKGLYGKTFF